VVDKTCLHGSSEYMTVNDVEGCRGSVPASTTDCSGTSDVNGTLFIRVERSSSQSSTCSYDLSIVVE
jgi:hypothetical protein